MHLGTSERNKNKRDAERSLDSFGAVTTLRGHTNPLECTMVLEGAIFGALLHTQSFPLCPGHLREKKKFQGLPTPITRTNVLNDSS